MYRRDIGIMERKMEATIWGSGFRAKLGVPFGGPYNMDGVS